MKTRKLLGLFDGYIRAGYGLSNYGIQVPTSKGVVQPYENFSDFRATITAPLTISIVTLSRLLHASISFANSISLFAVDLVSLNLVPAVNHGIDTINSVTNFIVQALSGLIHTLRGGLQLGTRTLATSIYLLPSLSSDKEVSSTNLSMS